MTTAGGRRTEKASERLALEIVQTIYETKMQPGDHYLSEAEALRTHGVARSTYREALRFLEIQGVIKIRNGPGGGPVISQPGWPHLASSVALLLQFANAPMQAVMEARNAIEPGMAEMAAQNASDDDIAAMERDLADVSETRIAPPVSDCRICSALGRVCRNREHCSSPSPAASTRLIAPSGISLTPHRQKSTLDVSSPTMDTSFSRRRS